MSIVPENREPGGWVSRASGPIPFEQLAREILPLYQPPLRAKATLRGLRHAIDVVSAVMGEGATTDRLNPDLVARVIASQPPTMSPFSIKNLLANLRILCNFALAQGYIERSPFQYRSRWIRTGRPPVRKHHSREDVRRVLELAASEASEGDGWPRWRARRLHALTALFCYTGVRMGEGLRVRVEDVDIEARMILIVSRAGNRLKTEASAAPVPIPEPLAAILAEWIPDCGGEWLFPGVTGKGPWMNGPRGQRPLDRLKALGERCGVQGLTFLSLRHTYATMSESWGLPPSMLQRILRHTSISTQRHYRHPDIENMRAAVASVGFDALPDRRDHS